ncbi:TPA: hypothetical protein ACGUPG_004325 [Vibrio vulnificus]|nr:hypothetical protein [Vibrio vulnificus]QBN14242.1 hypothetical protein E2I22_08910 [Vibrio vulnificus]HAS3051575.1 hypothetical protein [Vibrio parahaemolyticus]HCG9204670.1 hypothetical protein [Vibrio parahaemolyticus]
MNQFRSLNIDVVVNGETVRVDGKKRTNFVRDYGLDELIPNRYSEILVVDLLMNLELNGIDPRSIIEQIERLERTDVEGYTKQATQFKHAPLFPLWHQHYFSAHYLIHNIQNEHRRNFKNIWDKSMGEQGSLIEQHHINNLLHNAFEGAIETRSDEKRMTGEWLVFSAQETGNVYLCMATHTTGDENIYKKLAYCCERQFPLLEPFASDRSKAERLKQ